MNMKVLVGLTTAAMMIAGTALAQDATTRGGAQSAMPSTQQNSPLTGTSTTPSATQPGSAMQSGPATINNAPVGSSVQTEDQTKQAPRTGDSRKVAPIYR
jgi:hypothetical protein